MSAPTIVPTARLAPGTCFLSGDYHGPFIDTGKDLPRGQGRIYLSLKALGSFMRQAGWVPTDEIADELAALEDYEAANNEQREQARRYREIVDTITPLLPEAPPVVREIGIFQDDRVRRENERLQADLAELRALVADLEPTAGDGAPSETGSSEVETPFPATTDEPPAEVEVAGQSVDLDALLDRSVDEILSVTEGWDPTAREAVVAREQFRRASSARKTLLAGLEDQA